MNYPILMADIIKSGKKDSTTVMNLFNKIVLESNKKWKKNLLSPLTITLGDEFQGIPDTIEKCIKIIFEIEELIIQNENQLKLRYVVNYGKIDTKINTKIAYGMLGDGLTMARNRLNLLKNDESRFSININENIDLNNHLNKAFSIYQSFIDDWKPKDLKTVTEFLNHKDYKIVADIIKIDKSSAWRRKKSLKINEFIASKELIIYMLKEIKL